MPEWLKVTATCLSVGFFLAHAWRAWMLTTRADSRERRKEAVGAAVPGLAGLLWCTAIYAPALWLKFVLVLLAIPVLMVGRAIYELLVFRKDWK
jgi:TRAP-type C4-dicarboxylate transport system permease small subunit